MNIRSTIFVFGYTILLAILMFMQSYGFDADISFDDLSNEKILMLKISQVLSVVFLFVVPSLVYFNFFTKEKWEYLEFKKSKKQFIYSILTILLFITSIPLVNYIGNVNSMIKFPESLKSIEEILKTSEEQVNKMMEIFLNMENIGDLTLNLFVIAFVAAVSEELFFRGVLQNHLIKLSNKPHISIWITALLFSALHGQFFLLLPRMLLGVLLGYVYWYSKNIWIPILGHFLNNGVQVIAIYIFLKQHSLQEINKMEIGDQSILWVWLSLLGVIIVLFYLARLTSKNSIPIQQ